jgi:hypothetical protein
MQPFFKLKIKYYLHFIMPLVVNACATVHEDKKSELSHKEVPALISVDLKCSFIDGQYRNAGIDAENPSAASVTLDGGVFGTMPIKGTTEVVKLDFNFDLGKLNIDLIGQTVDPDQKSSSHGMTAECIDGWLKVVRSGSGYADGTNSDFNIIINLGLLEDKSSLLVHYIYDVKTTAMMFFKEKKSGADWYVFKKIQ